MLNPTIQQRIELADARMRYAKDSNGKWIDAPVFDRFTGWFRDAHELDYPANPGRSRLQLE